MKIRYLGTGAAEGVPAVFCNCPACSKARLRGGKEIHTRAQVLIDDTFGIEFPPDAYLHALAYHLDLSAIKNLIITHSHMDHFYAHDFILRGYKYAANMSSDVLRIYGNEEVCKVFSECTRRELKDCVKPHLSIRELKPFTEYEIDGFTVTPLVAQHAAAEQAFVYLIEKEGKGYLHLTDTGRPPESFYAYLAGCGKKVDLVCFDCTFLRFTKGEIGRHMGIEDNMAVKERLLSMGVCGENTRYLITHYSHNSEPLSENLSAIEKEYGVTALYDGMTVEC